jgi:hypothetical protein
VLHWATLGAVLGDAPGPSLGLVLGPAAGDPGVPYKRRLSTVGNELGLLGTRNHTLGYTHGALGVALGLSSGQCSGIRLHWGDELECFTGCHLTPSTVARLEEELGGNCSALRGAESMTGNTGRCARSVSHLGLHWGLAGCSTRKRRDGTWRNAWSRAGTALGLLGTRLGRGTGNSAGWAGW